MGFESFIAQKHLMHRRKTGFISLISFISVAGVAVGVMALIVVLAVMSGFDRELKNKIINVQPHLRIEKYGGIAGADAEIQKIMQRNVPGLLNASSFIEGQAIIRSQDNATGVIVKGLDSAHEPMSVYSQHLVSGNIDFSSSTVEKVKRRFFFWKKITKSRTGSILIGEELAQRLRVDVGSQVTLIAPFQDAKNPLSLLSAETRLFVVKGIFRVGMSDFDSAMVLISVPEAQDLYHMDNRVTGISLRFDEVDDAQKWAWRLRDDFGIDYVIRTWYDMNHSFFRALKVEKGVMTILLALIVLVASFNIVSTLIMVVMEKTKDIGILRALGATRASIRKIFMIEGFTIGLIGIAFGSVTGVIMAFNLNPISDFIKKTTGLEVFPSDVYFFDRIPSEVHAQDVAVIIGFALIASIIAAIYPAHRSTKLNPVEALHYE